MSGNRSVILGLFFLFTLGVLGYYTLFLTDFTLFKDRPEMTVHFSETNGLREGDGVLVAGMRWGRIKKLTFDPTAPIEKRVTVTASLDSKLPLRDGFKILIKDATLLGGRNLSIDPGPAEGVPVPDGQLLMGTVQSNPIEGLGRLVDASSAGVQETIENMRVFTRDLKDSKGLIGRLANDQGLADDLAMTVTSASRTMAAMEQIAQDLSAGKGTAGQLLANDALFQELITAAKKLTTVLDEAGGLAIDVRRGNGLVGQLVTNETLAKDVADALAAFRSVAQKIDAGQGTLGALVNDDSIARNVELITKNVAEGQGTIGALLTKSDVYDNLRQVTEDFAVVTSSIRSGQGTIGRFVMDDDLYQDLKTAVRIVQRALEEFREAAPITTFTSVFFGAF
ncbi:MAG: MlaD family protein [Planctomycetota bacterium]|nr:MlaD family protein [Planctomycetota bacterium]